MKPDSTIMSIQAKPESSVALTAGLTRNTLFNSMGVLWSVLLAFASTPYIVRGLAYEGYGLFGIVTLVAGYAGIFSGPMATGSVRFMAQAYARKEWPVFRTAAIAGVILSGGLALLGTVVILLVAPALPRLFAVTDEMREQAVVAFQLAAFGYLFSSIASALESIPVAIRRYDLSNGVKIAINTLRVFGILFAVWLGFGLLGAVVAQVIANGIAVLLFLWIARVYLYQFADNDTDNKNIDDKNAATNRVENSTVTHANRTSFNAIPFNAISFNAINSRWKLSALQKSIRQLFMFSLALLFQQAVAMVNQQIDRTVIGLFLGASSLTFYTVPLQISDRVPMLISSLTTALYPLSSEAIGGERLLELQQLYLQSVRLLVWLSAFLATLIVAGAQDILLLWVGPDFAEHSWFVLATLAVAAVWRTPSTVAFQVYNGLGRADIGVRLALLYFLGSAVTVLLLTPIWGINGAAMAILIATIPCALYADILTQRKLLGQTDWSLSLLPYVKPWIVGCILVLGCALLPNMGSWLNLGIQGIAIVCGFLSGLLLLDREILWAILDYARVTLFARVYAIIQK